MRTRFELLPFHLISLMIVAFASIPAFCEVGDTLPVHRNFISFNPVSLITGGIGGSYERMFGRSGFLLEGGYIFPVLKSTGYNFSLAYRFHFRECDRGGFLGPFINFGGAGARLVDEARNEYRYRFTYATAGMSIGKRGWLWQKHHWLYTYRVGLGYPLKKDWHWDPPPPDKINGVSTDFLQEIAGIAAYLDGELSLSFGF